MNTIIKPIERDLLEQMSRKELLDLLEAEQDVRQLLLARLAEQEAANAELTAGLARIGGILVKFQNRIFAKSSERSKPRPTQKQDKQTKRQRRKSNKLPSERYPDAQVIEREIELGEIPECDCCGEKMIDSGMTEVSEYVQVVPKEYVIIRQIRHKYCCGKCHSSVKTAPGFSRIKPGSSYGDAMIIDIAMSKYCDLIPVERYRAMAERQGFPGLPANSLIEATHHLADFVTPAVDKVKEEILGLEVLMADETPHRMLEGSEKSNWYLWGFSGQHACYFECHDTRSGDVAFQILVDSQCRVLVSDVYSGYAKAVRIANESRKKEGKSEIVNAYCNAHSRRKYIDCTHDFAEEVEFYIEQYRQIYTLNAQSKDQDRNEVLRLRDQMRPNFESMKDRAEKEMEAYSSKSAYAKALQYFLSNFEGLTRFLINPDIPIDNNAQERALRSPVVGRKTWYGTHSRRGAETAAKLFTLVESCKINSVNPRSYLNHLVQELHAGRPAITPREFKELEKT